MFKILTALFAIIPFSTCFSQSADSFSVDNWKNFNRYVVGETYGARYVEKAYVTSQGDTLIRRLTVTSGINQVQEEVSIVHGQPNGLSISYYQNGAIAEVAYYLNGKIWNVISRADSNGKLFDPGTLKNGTGIRYFFGRPEPNCYETYQNGVPEGPYYWQASADWAVKGYLTYNTGLVKHVPAKKVTYSIDGAKPITNVFDTAVFAQIFDGQDSSLKILKLSDDSVIEEPKEYKYISQQFGDPAIVPKGTWQLLNPERKTIISTVVFDDYGNAIKVTRYDLNGKIFSERNFPAKKERDW